MIVTLLYRGVSSNDVEEARYRLYNELKAIEIALAKDYDLVRIDEEDSNKEVHIYCDFTKKGGSL